jgi:tRNA-specific 2-thiouridylase
MSGGVDSSVAAMLMQREGYECTGATCKMFKDDMLGPNATSSCCSLADVEDAKAVCTRLGMLHYTFNFAGDFEQNVIAPFAKAYEAGLTPNPCINCNRYLKFDKLMRRARETGFDCMATGHYAQIAYDHASNRYLLKKAVDATKDQSYVLYTLTQDQLAYMRFPLGGTTKHKTRELASANGFKNADTHESQDICFVPDGDYANFIARYTHRAQEPGDILDAGGNVIGRHNGIMHFTIGQRKGIGVAAPKPLYVRNINPADNTITVVTADELGCKTAIVRDINLISLPGIDVPIHVAAKHRYRQQEQPVYVEQTGPDELRVTFDKPQRDLTCGQALVLYDGDVVIGGGTITSTFAV